jgi:hypothetical protein
MPIFTVAPSENTVKIGFACRFSVIFWPSDLPIWIGIGFRGLLPVSF